MTPPQGQFQHFQTGRAFVDAFSPERLVYNVDHLYQCRLQARYSRSRALHVACLRVIEYCAACAGPLLTPAERCTWPASRDFCVGCAGCRTVTHAGERCTWPAHVAATRTISPAPPPPPLVLSTTLVSGRGSRHRSIRLHRCTSC
eukprot:g52118.t1